MIIKDVELESSDGLHLINPQEILIVLKIMLNFVSSNC